MNQLKRKLQDNNIKVLFTDYYDTIVHRHVHPNYVLRIWSKFMIRELGLSASIDDLYFAFKESTNYLTEKLNTDRNELPYQRLKEELFKRLNNNGVVSDNQRVEFFKVFEKVQFNAEKSVQYLNDNTISVIKEFKAKKGKVYLISDFYGPDSLFKELLKHHGILDLFDGVYSSSSVGKSKHTGTIYKEVLSQLSIDPNNALMMGDNTLSDSINAEKVGLHSFVLPHKKYLKRNKYNALGNDYKSFKREIKKVYKACNKSTALPYSEYVLCYHFFIERLYRHCKQHNIKSLFFLSREGLFMKRLFDSYVSFHNINDANKIRTHYLKVSRQASLQISLKPIAKEEFSYLKRKYKSMSVIEFLSFFNFNKSQKEEIINVFEYKEDKLIDDFFYSDVFKKLINHDPFIKHYEAHRKSNKEVFSEYISSFNEDIDNGGINVVDIGWGGTMQEAIHKFYNQKIKVTGFYLGVNLIYNPTPDTKRFGLNFSVLPYEDYNCHILRANTQLYEQFAGAGHGCCVEYSKANGSYTIEHHEENEKWLYDNHIGHHQDVMFKVHQSLMEKLNPICYSDEMVTDILQFVALKTGLIQSNRKVEFLKTLTSGYYQNISNKKTGIDYKIPKNLLRPKEFVKFLMTPEKYFRFIVKVKQKLHSNNKLASFFYPGYIIYGYYKFNKYIRFKLLKRFTLLRFNYIK